MPRAVPKIQLLLTALLVVVAEAPAQDEDEIMEILNRFEENIEAKGNSE